MSFSGISAIEERKDRKVSFQKLMLEDYFDSEIKQE